MPVGSPSFPPNPGARSRRSGADVRALLLAVAAVLALLGSASPVLAAGPTDPTERQSPAVPEALPFYDGEEQRAVRAINAERAARGLDQLSFSPVLTEAAEWMSRDLRGRPLDHTDTLGRSLGARVRSFGYPAQSEIRENIARGYHTGAKVVAAWMDSSGHRENILATVVQAYGLARTTTTGGPIDWAWTLVLGSVVDADASRVPASLSAGQELARGWNLVSWPGDWITIEAVATTLPASVRSVIVWDAVSSSWFSFLPGAGISQFDMISPGQALWVLSDGPTTWRQPTAPAADVGREVVFRPGWQLVSWQGGDGAGLRDALADVLPLVRSAARFDAARQAYDLFVPGAEMSSFLSLDSGDAFWIQVSAEATWQSGG
jgi:uncharacterized protein YkwD